MCLAIGDVDRRSTRRSTRAVRRDEMGRGAGRKIVENNAARREAANGTMISHGAGVDRIHARRRSQAESETWTSWWPVSLSR